MVQSSLSSTKFIHGLDCASSRFMYDQSCHLWHYVTITQLGPFHKGVPAHSSMAERTRLGRLETLRSSLGRL
jgi:hypothetical protein